MVPPADERERRLVVVAIDRDVELTLRALELAGELRPHVEDAGRGLAELRVLRDPLLDRRLVDGAGIPVLAPEEPLRGDAAHEIRKSQEESHGGSPYPFRGRAKPG